MKALKFIVVLSFAVLTVGACAHDPVHLETGDPPKSNLASPSAAQVAPPLAPRDVTVIAGADIFDGTGRAPIKDGVIVIRRNRIAAIGTRSEVDIPKDAFVIDAKGKWITPGLVDAHIHFFQSAGIYTRPHIIDLRAVRSYEQEMAFIKRRLDDTFRRYLVSGVTAVVDVGGPFWNFEVRAKANSMVMAPRVAVAGPLISTVARPKLDIGDPPIIRAETPEEARALVREQLKMKPDLVKVWFIVSKKLSPDRGLAQTVGIMKAAVDEAHKAGVRAAVHATDTEAARAAVEAGAEILVHSIADAVIDDAMVQLIKSKNVILIPTLQVVEGYVEILGQDVKLTDFEKRYGDPRTMLTWQELDAVSGPPSKQAAQRKKRNDKRRPIVMKNLFKLAKAGVPIAVGTDAGNIGTLHGPSYHYELELMARAGMDNRSLLLAATRDAARVFSSEPEFGTLAKGKRADLLVLNGDPLADISNLQKIAWVVKGGVAQAPSQIMAPNPEWVIQTQVEAYNARDIDAFAALYADDIEIFRHPSDKPYMQGKEQLRKRYSKLFSSSPKLNCRVISRMVQNNIVVDHELVTGIAKRPYLHGVATYEVEHGLIQRVWFLPKEK